MLLVAFVQWWYGPGWRDAAGGIMRRVHNTYLLFSVPILLSTLFAPWHRITTPPGLGMEARFRAGIDNAISRGVGFFVRLFALVAALALMGFYLIFGGLLLILWPAAPLLGPILVVVGLL